MASIGTMRKNRECSAVLCVLNEVKTISLSLANLGKLGLDEVIVVDGGSTDGTVDILRKSPKIRLLELHNEGLLRQRLAGISSAKSHFILLVDVDDTIEGKDLDQNLELLARESHLDGVQFRLKTPRGNSWERGWASYFEVLTPAGKRLKLLGRPSIARRANFLQFQEAPPRVFGEDTWIHLQERNLGRNYTVGAGFSTRACPSNARDNFLQFRRYGQTDAELCGTFWEHLKLLFHSGFRIAIIRSSRALFRGNFSGFIFIFILGAARTTHHIKQWG